MPRSNQIRRSRTRDCHSSENSWDALERFDEERWAPPWIRNEHRQRFSFASRYVRGKTVVDCACGSGVGTRQFAEAGAERVIGIDQHIPNWRDRPGAEFFGNISFEQADATLLPLADSSADVFIALETIEHLNEAAAFLTEVCRVLRSDGLFVVSTPNRTVTNPGKLLQNKPWNQHHVREYAAPEFVALLASRFSRVELYGQNKANPALIQLLAHFPFRSGHASVRLRQVLKLPLLLFDHPARHEVIPSSGGVLYEYLIGVCAGPVLLRELEPSKDQNKTSVAPPRVSPRQSGLCSDRNRTGET